ncbi:Gfo/Idh/MocA family oxidoreductase [archaeon]|nr:Gfo/Idh/MocA family oxidoreductase [archaeon]
MNFLIIGLGSMGKRRIRNLQSLNESDIIGFDIQEKRRNEAEYKYQIKTFKDIKKALKQKPNAIIISTPPDKHYEYMDLAIKNNIPFFTELNLISKGLKERVEKGKDLLMAASCDMRYIESIKKIKELTNQIGKVTSFTYHVGQYLPDWHPWEDYRKFFGAKKETNACIEIIPGEINWLQDTFGKINSVIALKGKFSDLEIDAPDTYQIILKFKDLLGHYLVDVVSRTPYREIKIIGTEGTIVWDHNKKLVKLFKDKAWQEFPEGAGKIETGYLHKEEPYIEEMKTFISALKGEKEYPYLLSEDLETLKVLDAIEESTQTKKEVEI